jgi:23S rRNA pseudouridine2457 synthase
VMQSGNPPVTSMETAIRNARAAKPPIIAIRPCPGRHVPPPMSTFILFNKPYGVICQFSRESDKPTLKDFVKVPDVYPAGRLDTDSEGLLVLTDDGRWQARISDPRSRTPKTYWAQVEGEPGEDKISLLRTGLDLGDFVSSPAEAERIAEPAGLWARTPPIRYRANIPTSWLAITITQGKNRQVRRMTAKIGHPTLRLIRTRVGAWLLDDLAPGAWREAGNPPVQ